MAEALSQITELPDAPDRPSDSHKGTYGTVIVVGGSPTMLGAPALTAMAAFRSGVGLCKIAALPSILPFIISQEPSTTGIFLDPAIDDVLKVIDEADPGKKAVLAIGPGLGRSPANTAMVLALLQGKHPIVLDADGLNALASTGQPRPSPSAPLVMTPHPGEFERLAAPLGITQSPTDPVTRPQAAAALALAHKAVVVLKGHQTIVTDGWLYYLNDSGNPCLATAGSGDVLTGIIAALIAQKMPLFDAAVLAVHIHGYAADLWAQRNGPAGMTAQSLTRRLPAAFNSHRMLNHSEPF
jgi:NAD(P)H-hydrate epimerase